MFYLKLLFEKDTLGWPDKVPSGKRASVKVECKAPVKFHSAVVMQGTLRIKKRVKNAAPRRAVLWKTGLSSAFRVWITVLGPSSRLVPFPFLPSPSHFLKKSPFCVSSTCHRIMSISLKYWVTNLDGRMRGVQQTPDSARPGPARAKGAFASAPLLASLAPSTMHTDARFFQWLWVKYFSG